MTLSSQMLNNLVLKFKPCVIAANVYFHRPTFSKKKENRWHFCQRFLT
jgi:hypothetical protein